MNNNPFIKVVSDEKIPCCFFFFFRTDNGISAEKLFKMSMREQFYFLLYGNDLGFEIVKMFINSLFKYNYECNKMILTELLFAMQYVKACLTV